MCVWGGDVLGGGVSFKWRVGNEEGVVVFMNVSVYMGLFVVCVLLAVVVVVCVSLPVRARAHAFVCAFR